MRLSQTITGCLQCNGLRVQFWTGLVSAPVISSDSHCFFHFFFTIHIQITLSPDLFARGLQWLHDPWSSISCKITLNVELLVIRLEIGVTHVKILVDLWVEWGPELRVQRLYTVITPSESRIALCVFIDKSSCFIFLANRQCTCLLICINDEWRKDSVSPVKGGSFLDLRKCGVYFHITCWYGRVVFR